MARQRKSRTKFENMPDAERREKLNRGMESVIQELQKLLGEQMSARQHIEKRWMEDLRAYHGIYEADVVGRLSNDSERSKVFVNLTGPKTRAWDARLTDLLFPADDKNWGISPTPVPELAEAAQQAVAQIDDAEARIKELVEQNNAMADQAADPEQAAELIQGDRDVRVLVGVDPDDHSTLPAGLVHADGGWCHDSSQESRDGNWPAGWTGL